MAPGASEVSRCHGISAACVSRTIRTRIAGSLFQGLGVWERPSLENSRVSHAHSMQGVREGGGNRGTGSQIVAFAFQQRL